MIRACRIWVLLLMSLTAYVGQAQQRVSCYPTYWFTQMKWSNLQLMLHAPGINQYQTVDISAPGVSVLQVHHPESKNYLIVDISIGEDAKPGNLSIQLSGGGKAKPMTVSYELKARRQGNGSGFATGVNSSDFIYLIMPDRFSNGDPKNDVVKGYRDTIADRKNPSAHHGGDLQGVINKLDYLKDLGVSAVWMCPVVENDMPWKQEAAGAISGYHGYWITDHYRVDRRYGTEDTYRTMVDEAHKRGVKVIQDAVYNHLGDEHFLFRDKPYASMFNNWPSYTGSNHREEALFSAYTSEADRKQMLEGWFVQHLPDVNLANPFMANFMIQNVLWSTEAFGIDGWRIDTYKYCYEPFLNAVNDALFADFPKLSVFGEAWANSVVGSAYFARNNMKLAFNHNCPGVTDFPLQGAMLSMLQEDFGWTNGANRLMMTLSQDVLYKQPLDNCIFLDNHDVDRFVTMIGGDMSKFKMGIGMLLTMRGIPQLYFGTEIFMANDQVQGDGKKRNDFPGGFPGDPNNKFEAGQRNLAEQEAFQFVRSLARFRRDSKALQVGRTIDFLPRNGLYGYVRQHENEAVLVLINQNKAAQSFGVREVLPSVSGYFSGRNIITNTTYNLSNPVDVPAKGIVVLSLQR